MGSLVIREGQIDPCEFPKTLIMKPTNHSILDQKGDDAFSATVWES